MLIERLTQIQRALGMSDREFARRIGVSGAMWTMVRNKQRRLGPRALGGIHRAFPELREDVFDYAVSDRRPLTAA